MSESGILEDRSFCLAGPMRIAEAGRTPVRGDLAHIRLAGRYFVPHYAVPMSRTVALHGADLVDAGKAGAAVIERLAPGTPFGVLDIAGAFAWGQVGTGEDGLVGYVRLDALEGEQE